MKTKYQKVLCVAVLLGSAVTVSAQEDETKKKLVAEYNNAVFASDEAIRFRRLKSRK